MIRVRFSINASGIAVLLLFGATTQAADPMSDAWKLANRDGGTFSAARILSDRIQSAGHLKPTDVEENRLVSSIRVKLASIKMYALDAALTGNEPAELNQTQKDLRNDLVKFAKSPKIIQFLPIPQDSPNPKKLLPGTEFMNGPVRSYLNQLKSDPAVKFEAGDMLDQMKFTDRLVVKDSDSRFERLKDIREREMSYVSKCSEKAKQLSKSLGEYKGTPRKINGRAIDPWFAGLESALAVYEGYVSIAYSQLGESELDKAMTAVLKYCRAIESVEMGKKPDEDDEKSIPFITQQPARKPGQGTGCFTSESGQLI